MKVKLKIRCGMHWVQKAPACVAIRPIDELFWQIELRERCGKHDAGSRLTVPKADLIQEVAP